MTRRTERINELIRQEISQLLSRDLNDPRLSGVVTITQVKTSSDLRLATVYVSVLGDRAKEETVLSGVSSAAKYIRKELGLRLALRYVPELKFVLDETMNEAEHIYQLMEGLSTEEPESP